VNAAVTAVAHGWRTDAEVAAEYGNDIDDNIAEAERIARPKMEAGLVTVGNGLGSQSATADNIVMDTDKEDTDNGNTSQKQNTEA
jgi:hypothetical protein